MKHSIWRAMLVMAVLLVGVLETAFSQGSLWATLPTHNKNKYALQVGATVQAYIYGATDVSQSSGTIPIIIQSSVLGNSTVTGTVFTDAQYGKSIMFSYTAPANGCQTNVVTYNGHNANSDLVDDGIKNGTGSNAAGFAFYNSGSIVNNCVTCETNPPVIGQPGADATIDCPASPVFTAPTATDDSPNPVVVLVSDVTTPGNCAGAYTRTKTWKAVDACGNESGTVSQTINVQDVTAPAISALPGPSTIDCPATPVFATPTATDGCDSNPSLAYVDATAPGNCAGNYSVTRTWTARDACGNSSSASQTINVQDVTAPAISALPGPSTIDCPATPVFATPTATDGCDSNPSLAYVDATAPGNCAGNYSVTRTWTAVDVCGNSSSASQTINVVDTKAPVLSGVPGSVPLVCFSAVPSPAGVTATDDCGGAIIQVIFNESQSNLGSSCNNVITRTWSATDACGNVASASQTITVNDNVAPILSGVPGDITVPLNGIPAPPTVTASDNCDPNPSISFSETQVPGSCGGSIITRTWTATDACGNFDRKSQTITVRVPIVAVKFYDSNANGQHDVGEAFIAGWQFTLSDGNGGNYLAVTDNNGMASFNTYGAAPYAITEVSPNEVYWQSTTPTLQSVSCGGTAYFGNICVGGGNGFTLGFWSSKNGERTIKDAPSSDAPELTLLSGLNLRKADGSNFDPNSYGQFRSWILSANATNMAYMLSAQLAAMALNVESGSVSSAAVVQTPGCSTAYMTIGDLMAAANASLGAYGLTPDGHPARAMQNCLKNALDNANNNRNFIQSTSCAFTFTTIASNMDGGSDEAPVVEAPETKESVTEAAAVVELPKEFGLDANYPNPFNPSTTIRYAMRDAGTVRLAIYNILGQMVATLVDGVVSAGYHQITWNAVNDNGEGLPSGIYFYRLEVKPFSEGQGFVQSKKMLLMK